MPALNLPESPMAACWRIVRDRLEADTTLRDAGVDVEFAEDRDALRGIGDFPADRAVAIVTGSSGPWQWASEHSHSGALLLTLDVFLRTYDFADALNLQAAIFKALYGTPADDAFRTSLTAAGATTGEPRVVRPLAKSGTEKNNAFVALTGQLALEIDTSIFRWE